MRLRRRDWSEGGARERKRAKRREKLSLRKREPAREAGFFAVADRVRQ
jgi:hypothetical protein